MKKVFIACDHGGFEIKNSLMQQEPQVPWVDLGTNSSESVDYPDYADQLCQRLITETTGLDSAASSLEIFGVLICGSGQGMAIRANRYPQIRAALCFNAEITALAREHNNANVLVLPGRYINAAQAREFFKIFAETRFAGGRHSARVAKLAKT
jgi:ribose 5-phosphate isomerase B